MMGLKNVIKATVVGTVVIGMLSFNATSYAALLGWDLVDSSKHLDYNTNTKYTSIVTSGVNTWENYKYGIIRKDTASTVEDVYMYDYYEVSSTMAVTSSGGTIKFNDYHFQSMTTAQRQKTITHEIGHALGLAHTWGTYDIMQQGKLSITTLSSTDKSSYDAAYRNY